MISRASAVWIIPAASLWLVFEHLVLGSASVMLNADNAEIILPGLLSPQFAGVDNPLWDNFSAAGIDRIVDGHFAWLDIFLFSQLPGWLAHGLRIAVQTFIAMLCVYLLCRRTLDFGIAASLFVAFAYTVQIHPFLVASVTAFLPLVLLALTLVLERRRDFLRWSFLTIAVLMLVFTSFYSRLIPLASAMVVVWFLFVDTKKDIRDWAIILAVCLAVVALRTTETLAFMAFTPLSQLSLIRELPVLEDEISRTLWPTFFFGSYINSLFTLLFVYALVALKGGNLRMKLILALLLLSGLVMRPVLAAFLITMSNYFSFFKGFNLHHYVANIFHYTLVFASGFGIQVLVDQMQEGGKGKFADWGRWGKRGALVVAVGVLLFASLIYKYSSLYNWVTQGTYARNFQSPVLQELATEIRSKPFPERVEPFQIQPAHLHAYGIETAGIYESLLYRRYFDFWGMIVDKWVKQLDPKGYYGARYARRVKTLPGWPVYRGDRLMLYPDEHKPEWRLSELYNLKLLSLANVAYFVSRDRLLDEGLVPIREVETPWSALSKRERTRVNIRENFEGRKHLYIYRNRNVFPRFFTVNGIKVFENGEQTLKAMAGAPLEEVRNILFIEASDLPEGISPQGHYGAADIRLEAYKSDEIRLKISADEPAIMVVSNSFSPFWSCEVDGVETPIFPAYHAFWGIALPAGAKSVVFRFTPPYYEKS